jgi:hypothetical protein
MSITIPNQIYERAAAICDDFPIIDFVTIASIIYADTLHEANKPDPFAPSKPPKFEPVKTESEPKQDEPKTEPKPTEKKIHRRKQTKILVVDGVRMDFKNAAEICKTFSIDSKTYLSIVNGITYKADRGSEVRLEAERMKAAIEAKGHKVTAYYAYSFDDKWTQIVFEKGEDGNA